MGELSILSIALFVGLLTMIISAASIGRTLYSRHRDLQTARIRVRHEGTVTIVDGVQEFSGKPGYAYRYKWHGKRAVLYVPPDYPILWESGRRVLDVESGSLLPAWRETTGSETELVGSILQGQLLLQTVRALTMPSGKLNWKIFLIIGVLAVAAILLMRHFGIGFGGGETLATPTPIPEVI